MINFDKMKFLNSRSQEIILKGDYTKNKYFSKTLIFNRKKRELTPVSFKIIKMAQYTYQNYLNTQSSVLWNNYLKWSQLRFDILKPYDSHGSRIGFAFENPPNQCRVKIRSLRIVHKILKCLVFQKCKRTRTQQNAHWTIH